MPTEQRCEYAAMAIESRARLLSVESVLQNAASPTGDAIFLGYNPGYNYEIKPLDIQKISSQVDL